MKTINLKKYAPVIVGFEEAKEIYNLICGLNPKENKITIDLNGIEAMTTRCAKIIFGVLYLDLGPDIFYENIELVNCSDGLRVSIEFGIEHALTFGK